jgi:hypothetical protein
MAYFENLPAGGFRILFYVGRDVPSGIHGGLEPEFEPDMDPLCFLPINGMVIIRKVTARSLQREPELLYPGEIV